MLKEASETQEEDPLDNMETQKMSKQEILDLNESDKGYI